MSRQATPAPQTPHPRAHAAAPRGIKFPISQVIAKCEVADAECFLHSFTRVLFTARVSRPPTGIARGAAPSFTKTTISWACRDGITDIEG